MERAVQGESSGGGENPLFVPGEREERSGRNEVGSGGREEVGEGSSDG